MFYGVKVAQNKNLIMLRLSSVTNMKTLGKGFLPTSVLKNQAKKCSQN